MRRAKIVHPVIVTWHLALHLVKFATIRFIVANDLTQDSGEHIYHGKNIRPCLFNIVQKPSFSEKQGFGHVSKPRA